MVVLGAYTYGASSRPKFLRESAQKGTPPRCAQTGVKSNLGTEVLMLVQINFTTPGENTASYFSLPK